MTRSVVSRLLLAVIALFPVCFLIWHLLYPLVAGPAVLLSKQISTLLFGDLLQEVRINVDHLLVVTRYVEAGMLVDDPGDSGQRLAIDINTRLVSFAIPFYAALHFATPRTAAFSSFSFALLLLWPAVALGLTLVTAKDLIMTVGPAAVVGEQHWLQEVIFLGYQFSVLILPTVLPLVMWLLQLPKLPAFKGLFRSACIQ